MSERLPPTAAPPTRGASPRGRLILASQSPRRRQLLAERGVVFEVREPGLEDSDLHHGQVHAGAWAAALAYVKASAVARVMADRGEDRAGVVILGADTVVVESGRFVGKPADGAEARAMIRAMRGGRHGVVTGVALVDAGTGERVIVYDAATVEMGEIADEEVERYVASGAWRGKAGGYNLTERLAAGWRITCHGDPTTVVGLPMTRVMPLLRERGLAGGGS